MFILENHVMKPLGSKHVAAIERQEILILFIPCAVIILFFIQQYTHVDFMTLQLIVMKQVFCIQQQATQNFLKLQIIDIRKLFYIASAIGFHSQADVISN